MLVQQRRPQAQGATETQPPHRGTRPTVLEAHEWPPHLGVGPISYDQAGQATGVDLCAVQNQVSEILRSQYEITPKRGAITYAKPYQETYDLLDPP